MGLGASREPGRARPPQSRRWSGQQPWPRGRPERRHTRVSGGVADLKSAGSIAIQYRSADAEIISECSQWYQATSTLSPQRAGRGRRGAGETSGKVLERLTAARRSPSWWSPPRALRRRRPDRRLSCSRYPLRADAGRDPAAAARRAVSGVLRSLTGETGPEAGPGGREGPGARRGARRADAREQGRRRARRGKARGDRDGPATAATTLPRWPPRRLGAGMGARGATASSEAADAVPADDRPARTVSADAMEIARRAA